MNAVHTAAGEPAKYVTFQLSGDMFALEISKVREVLDLTAITKVPQTPPFMRGVINLRGSVVPVVDFRRKFDMGEMEETRDSRILIVEINVDNEVTVLGAVADAVRDVIDLTPQDISPPPRIGTRLNTEFIKGIGKQDETFLIILDIDRVFTFDEISRAKGMEQSMNFTASETEIPVQDASARS